MNPLELALCTLAQKYTNSDPKLERILSELATIAAYDYVEHPEVIRRRKEDINFRTRAELWLEDEKKSLSK